MYKRLFAVVFFVGLMVTGVMAQNSNIAVPRKPSKPANNRPANNSQSNTRTFTVNGVSFKMVKVAGGSFLMGCTSEQYDCDEDENNVRRVTLDEYYIATTEVTQALWEAVMGTNIYQQRNKHYNDVSWARIYGEGDDYPICYVSWEEALEFCRRLSDETGMTFTLPTEAQWEYAARGGKNNSNTVFSGNNMIDIVCWYSANSNNETHPVGQKRPNALGLYDMSGNVWEWCKDWYSSYTSYDTNNPTGPSSGSFRVNRGGSWDDNASFCRVANRISSLPGERFYGTGFRVVLLP